MQVKTSKVFLKTSKVFFLLVDQVHRFVSMMRSVLFQSSTKFLQTKTLSAKVLIISSFIRNISGRGGQQ